MFERIFGKRKSLQRNLVIDLIICIIIVMFISLVGFYIFVNKETLNSLIQVNFENKEQIKEILGITRRSLVLLIINTILISTIVMRITSKKILQPIKKMTEATKKVASGDFNVKLESQREDEIGELTQNFNQMVNELGKVEVIQKDFINNVSHEIKTPISSIQGFAKLLEDENLPEAERKEYAEIIIEESNRLLNLSTNILRLSKIQNQGKIVRKDHINITEQLRKAIAVLENKWNEKSLTFNISAKDVYYDGDEELTFQVWMNLIDNAIKFSKQNGKITIDVKEENDEVVVKIKDNGMGMSKEEQERIFTRFYQIDKSHSQEGSGLGLSIVKSIIDLSGGKIEVESKENSGTTFIIKLPIEKENNNYFYNVIHFKWLFIIYIK
jgi:signal transduction histidine kinase